ncbi:MAG: hypothetical protein PHC61_15855, partial [Chitinivibrionales bacterium]|nr:hypothetical protein [Chitinivibrionales bacterium]
MANVTVKFLAAAGVLASCALAQMQSVSTGDPAQGNGEIDWATRTVVAVGIGAPNPDMPQAAQRPGALRAA